MYKDFTSREKRNKTFSDRENFYFRFDVKTTNYSNVYPETY